MVGWWWDVLLFMLAAGDLDIHNHIKINRRKAFTIVCNAKLVWGVLDTNGIIIAINIRKRITMK